MRGSQAHRTGATSTRHAGRLTTNRAIGNLIPFEALQEGQRVEFTLVVTPQGPRARRVSGMEAVLAPRGENS
jgi:hypothetical protein